MKRKIYIILIQLIVGILAAGCSGRSSMTASGWASITSDDDTAYVSFNTHVIAVNLVNGTERWRFPSEPDPKVTFYATPELTENGDLIVGGYDNVLYKINSQNGQGTALYDGAEGRYIGGPLVVQDLIFAPSADHVLYAVDMDGQQVWQYKTDEPLWAQPGADPDCNCVYLTSMDHKVYAIELESGKLKWRSDDLGGSIVGTPTISDDMVVFVGTFNNELIALDAANGRENWRFKTSDWVWAGPSIHDNNLYFGDLSGTFYAVDRETGVSKWQIQPGGPIVGKPLVTEEAIYFTTDDGSFVCVNHEGAIRWNQPFETSLHAGPVAAGEVLLIATSDPERLLIAVDHNGVQKWTFGLE